MTYDEALDALPSNATWTCSFGNPGEPGYAAYFRTPGGVRYRVSNDANGDLRPYSWKTVYVDGPGMPGPTSTCIEHGPGGTLRLSHQIKVF